MSGAEIGRNDVLVGEKYCAAGDCPAVNPQPYANFNRNASEPTGYHRYCKVCRARHRDRHKEEQRQRDRERYERERGRRIANATKYYAANTEKVKGQRRQAYAALSPEEKREIQLAANARRRTPRGREASNRDCHNRRARMVQVAFEKFDREEIFERDGWVCQLCSEPVDASLCWPHRKSKSLDHIVPLALGGTHTRDNVQLAHLSCNISKGRKVREENGHAAQVVMDAHPVA